MIDEKTRQIRFQQMKRPRDILSFLNEAKNNNGIFTFPVNSNSAQKQFEDFRVFLKHTMKEYNFLMLPNCFSKSDSFTPAKREFFKKLVVEQSETNISLNVYSMFGLPEEEQTEKNLNDIISFFTLLNKYFLKYFDDLYFELAYATNPTRVIPEVSIDNIDNEEISKEFESLISNSKALTLWTEYLGEYLKKIRIHSGFLIFCDSTLSKKDFMRLLKEKY